jgi:hypothetical protein
MSPIPFTVALCVFGFLWQGCVPFAVDLTVAVGQITRNGAAHSASDDRRTERRPIRRFVCGESNGKRGVLGRHRGLYGVVFDLCIPL